MGGQIAHYPTLLSVPADLAVPIISEIEQYKSGLRACYASYGASLLSFEVGRLSGKGGHAHVQVRDIPFVCTPRQPFVAITLLGWESERVAAS